jgi:hypothetical protein
MFFQSPEPSPIDGWVCIRTYSSPIDAEMTKAFLTDREISCEILSKHDSALAFTVGDMAVIFLYVPKVEQENAETALQQFENASSDDLSEE